MSKSDYEYKTASLFARMSEAVFSKNAAISEQLLEVINEHAKEGWEFYRLETVHTQVSPGCLGGLLGQRSRTVYVDVAVFRRRLILQ